MRLIEEKQSIIIQLIMLVVIILSGIIIQICDAGIADHNNDTLMQMMHVNRIQSERTCQLLLSVQYSFFAHANTTIVLDEPQLSSASNFEELMAIVKNYKDGKLTDQVFFNKMANAHSKQVQHIAQKYERKLDDLGDRIDKGTSWSWAKRILIVIQTIAVVVAAILYINLVKSIDSRIAKKTS